MCTEVLEDIGSFVIPSYLFTNSDDTAKQLISIAKRVGRELARLKLQHLEKEATVTTVADTDNYALPADFLALIPNTAWDATTNTFALGQETAMSWQAIINLPITVTTAPYFRIRGNRLYIKPTPSSEWSFTYEYRSSYYCESIAGTDIAEWAADDDTPLLPEDLFIAGIKYYFLKANQLYYSDAEAEYNELIDFYVVTGKPHGIINMAQNVSAPGRGTFPSFNIPDRVDS